MPRLPGISHIRAVKAFMREVSKDVVETLLEGELNPLASVWMCIENIMLAMAAEGLFGCTYTPYDSADLKKHLGVPDGYEIASIIPFGYPRSLPEPRDDESLVDRLHIDKW